MTFESGGRLEAHVLKRISYDTDILDLFKDTCTCCEFQLNRMQCFHVTCAACFIGKSLYDLCSSYYTSEYWRVLIAKQCILHREKWIGLFIALIRCSLVLSPIVCHPLGRPLTQCKRSRYESATHVRKYTRCGRVGHN